MNATVTLSPNDLHLLASALHPDPFSVLGRHRVADGETIRVLRPEAKEILVVSDEDSSQVFPAERIGDPGVFEAFIDEDAQLGAYKLRITTWDGVSFDVVDPYSFGRVLGEVDTHLFAEGNHYEIYKKLGAHIQEIGGYSGVTFSVWAPNASRISVVGEFNNWDGRVHPMRKIDSGIWEIFIPGLGEGVHYKFEVRSAYGHLQLKSDPFAFYGQHGRETASMVFDINRFTWSDDEWMEKRKSTEWQKRPVSIYEVHLGSWQRVLDEENRFLSYIEATERLIDYAIEMGFTHIEFLPLAEHPFDGSWGYQVTGYYAITSRFGNPDEFRHFVNRAHQRGLGIILDWVPGHFPKDAHGLARFDGTALYEHEDPRQGEHQDWGTLIFNYGRNEVRNFLIGNALFLLDEYHIDGLRVDAVASMLYLDYSRKEGEWVPNAYGGRENLEAIYFLKRFNEVCYEKFPGIMTMAEESTSWPGVSRPTYLGGLGFGFKWNMGWMHDFLVYMSKEPVYRRYHQSQVTFSLLYAFQEHFILVLSHDEVVHGKGSLIAKMPGDDWQKFANLRMFYAWMWAHPGKKLLFQGCEFGQWAEWNHGQSLDWHLCSSPLHAGLKRLVQHLNHLYQNEPAFYELDDTWEGFDWIDFHDADNSVVAFLRRSKNGGIIVFVVNATPVPRFSYRVGAPFAGFYREVLNTDAEAYGGGNIGNYGGFHAEGIAWQGRDYSLSLNLPPLATIGLKWEP
ncbi:MAG TPA: 1,4-alpha-glucan branching protein GlgB [Chthoniobacterales bacterium]